MKRFIKLIYWLLTNRYSHILLGVVVVGSAISEFGADLIHDLTEKNGRGLHVGHDVVLVGLLQIIRPFSEIVEGLDYLRWKE